VFFGGRASGFGWIEVSEENIVVDAEKGHYCTLLCNTPFPATLSLLPTILRNIFSPRPPLLQ